MKLAFVTLRIILENIINGIILSFLSFFFCLLSFPTLFIEVRQLERRPNLIIFRFLWNNSVFEGNQFPKYNARGGGAYI